MKIALFSPLPPKKTGIALYTQNMILSLKKFFEFTLFDFSSLHDKFLGMQIYDYVDNPSLTAALDDYDLVVYHIGNNPSFHTPIYHVLLQHPGIIILHDAVIYHLVAGQNKGSFIKDFIINYGFEKLPELQQILTENNDNPMAYSKPERYPLLKTIVDRSKAIIVHSETARQIVLAQGYTDKVYVIPFMIYYDVLNFTLDPNTQHNLRNQLRLNEAELIISILGFIGSNRRLPSILLALKKLKSNLNFKLLFVGMVANQELEDLILSYGLKDNIIYTGYLNSDQDFFSYMNLSDLIINLRYPSMGETSSIVIQALYFAKACIVTNKGWPSELPDDIVYKIPYDEREVDCLVEAILFLSIEKNRQAMGLKASQYIQQHYPDQVSLKYCEIFNTLALSSKLDNHDVSFR
jgi:glycosyltransferase involved in cell wall biosynthesis